MKKIFGGINLTWPKVVIMAILTGLYTAAMAMIPALRDTSFHDIAVSFEVWIFFGIFIIMNSKSNKDSALKCFVFFVISQPLVYIVQDVFNGSELFKTYYQFWIVWTIACLPMGYIGYYIKKDKWWGLVILTPMMIFLGLQYSTYFSETMFSFPRHLLTVLFCMITLLIYPLALFENKKNKIIGLVIDLVIINVFTAICLIKPPVYSTDVTSLGKEIDETYKVYLVDKKYGDLSIRYEEAIEQYLVHAEFKKAGKTQFVIEDKDGNKTKYNITIKRDTYDVKEIKN